MQLRLKTRLSMGLAALGVAMAALLVVLLLTFFTARQGLREVHDNYLPSIDLTNRLLIRLDRMQNAEYLYFAPGLDPAAQMQAFDAEAKAFDGLYLALRPLAKLPGERELYARLGQRYGAYLHLDQRMRAMIADGRAKEARVLNVSESLALGDAMRTAAEELHRLNVQESEVAHQQAERALWMTGGFAIALYLVGGLIAGALWWRNAREIAEPLHALRVAAVELERGEYPQVRSRLAHHTVELDELLNAFNRMASGLARLAGELKAANANLEDQVAQRTRELTTAKTQLETMVEELKTVDKLKSDFMAVVSHELLTPIYVISGFGAALEDGLMGPLTPEQAQTLHQMMEGTERLTRMVRNVLTYTQIEAGRIALRPEALDVAALARDAAENVPRAPEGHPPRLELELPEALPDAWADPARVDQILRELLDNAAKFAGPGRMIWLKAYATPASVFIEVADAGEGIPTAVLPHIFQPFYQADFTSTRRHGGLGLGLAIAHRLAALMGGALEAAARAGGGAVFRLRLPRAYDASA